MNPKLDHPSDTILFLTILGRAVVTSALVCALLQWSTHPVAANFQKNLVGPVGSGKFGSSVAALPNGNLVITDPYYDSSAAVDVGAVYLYNGLTGALISTLIGSTANDRIGSSGVTALTNGNFVVKSSYWNNGSTTSAGAATWGNGTTGISGVVSADNSLVGNTIGDEVGADVIPLTNGNYVTFTRKLDGAGSVKDVGAVTWGNGATGTSGVVSSANSLVGSTANDKIGNDVTALTNGNYVVHSYSWGYGSITYAGAATWGDGTSGVVGPVSSSNSLIGNTAYDFVSGGGVTALTNGNYVVSSSSWDDVSVVDAGAATWGDGTNGITGTISSSNSLVGSTDGDAVSSPMVTALTNGNYVVASYIWDSEGAVDAGAATWGNGITGVVGPVSSANSLIGSSTFDEISFWAVIPLTNGNYVVVSPCWNSGGKTYVGAATWGSGTTGRVGMVSAANSLVGSATEDRIGWEGVTALSNGNYVVLSPRWNSGGTADVGAATWVNGSTGLPVGSVSSSNSLVGSTAYDTVGSWVQTALSNGNFVLVSPNWNNGETADVGAFTWGNGAGGTIGTVSATNSLVGSTANDLIDYKVTALDNGDYAILIPNWDNAGIADAGAVTWGKGTGGTTGPITAENSVLGLVMNQGGTMNFTHNNVHSYLAVGKPAENLVILFWSSDLYLPIIKK